MSPLIAALLLGVPGMPAPANVHDGGFCVGMSWVTLAPGEAVTDTYGPDFDVYHVKASGGAHDADWSVYAGGFAAVHGEGRPLAEHDGVTIQLAITQSGKPNGWLAQKGRAQNHFFGPLFTGTAKDLHFFDRIDFGPRGQALCAERR